MTVAAELLACGEAVRRGKHGDVSRQRVCCAFIP